MMVKSFIRLDEFDAHIEDWLLLRERMGHQDASVISGRKDIRLFSTFCHEQKHMRIFGKTLTEYIHWLSKTRRNGSGAINRKRASLKCYINHLRLKQVKGAESFPIEYLPRARHPYSGPIKTLEPQEVKVILNGFDIHTPIGYRDFVFFNMQYAMGLRIGEVVKIDLQDIDFAKREITIHGKGRRQRLLPLIEPLIPIIKKWIGYRSQFLNKDKSSALFLSKKGHRISQRTVQEKFQTVIKSVGTLSLEKVVPHTLRHAYASHAMESEQDLLIIKYVLGHASLKSTEIYLHPSMKLLKKSAEAHLACDLLDSLQEAGSKVKKRKKAAA